MFPKVRTNPQRAIINPSSKLHDNSEICNSMFVDIIVVIQVFVGFLGRQFLISQKSKRDGEWCVFVLGYGSEPVDYKGKTRKPEKVEYFHPPIKVPLSSFR